MCPLSFFYASSLAKQGSPNRMAVWIGILAQGERIGQILRREKGLQEEA